LQNVTVERRGYIVIITRKQLTPASEVAMILERIKVMIGFDISDDFVNTAIKKTNMPPNKRRCVMGGLDDTVA
jgi:hypothetical protein